MKKGKFIVCGSHTGQMRDLPSRVLETIKSVDYVFCEHFESFTPILDHYEIQPPPFLYEITEADSENKRSVVNKMDEILQILESGNDVAFICQHGMPGLADPGTNIVSFLHEKNIEIVIIPGPDVIGISLAAAGIKTSATTVIFDEFMDKSDEQIKEKLLLLAQIDAVMVLIDFPTRMPNLIAIAQEAFGADRFAALCSKVTFNEQKVIRGKLCNLVDMIDDPETFVFSSLVVSADEIFKQD